MYAAQKAWQHRFRLRLAYGDSGVLPAFASRIARVVLRFAGRSLALALMASAPASAQSACVSGTKISDFEVPGQRYSCTLGINTYTFVYTFNISELNNGVSYVNFDQSGGRQSISFNALTNTTVVDFFYEVQHPFQNLVDLQHTFTQVPPDVPPLFYDTFIQNSFGGVSEIRFTWDPDIIDTDFNYAELTSITHTLSFDPFGVYWDGGTGEYADNNQIDGGPGTWNATARNWTITGAINSDWLDRARAYFAGPAGGVVNVAGTRLVDELYFVTDGYVLREGVLELAAPPTHPSNDHRISVNPDVSARIESRLTDGGADKRLIKTGAGVLILAGDNSYTGGTLLLQGILGVGHDNALGPGELTVGADTTLRAAADGVSLGNAVTLNDTGTVDTQAFALTLRGIVSGNGSLAKAGAGSLILSGGTILSAVDVQGGTLDNRSALSASATMTLSGDGARLLNAQGASVTVQGGAGTLSGGAGAQRVENAGSIASAVRLGGGDDAYILWASGAQSGAVDGGSGGSDQLRIETAAGATRSLGDGAFAGFETVELNLDAASTGNLVITGGLALDAGLAGGAITLHRGQIRLQAADSEVRAGSLLIARDALLSGSGLISTGPGAPDGLIVNGTIAPGNSIGTLNVAGRYAQTGVYEVEFRAPVPGVAPVRGVDNDLIRVTGEAVLGNGATLRLLPLSAAADYDAALAAPGNPTPGELRYTIIETTGGLSSGPLSLLGFTGASAEQVGNDLQLVLTSGGGEGVLVDQAPGQLAVVLPQDPLFGCRGRMFGRNAGSFTETQRGQSCGWADAFGVLGGIDDVSGGGAAPYDIPGVDYNTKGIAVGHDRALDGQTYLGGSFTYAATDATYSGDAGSQTLQGFHGTLYWAFDDGVWNAGVFAGYSHYEVDGQRTTGLPSSPLASARYDMQQYRVGGVVRRVVTLGDNWWLVPEGRMSWEPLSHDGFAETGGGDANFSSEGADWDIAKAGAGVTLRHRFDAQPEWMAEVGLGWQTLLGDTSMLLEGKYEGAQDTLYETPGDAYLRDSMTVRGSLTYRHSDQIGLGLDYAGQFNAGSSHNQFGIMARVLF